MGETSNYANFVHSNGTTAYETFSVILPSALLVYVVTYLSNLCRWKSRLFVFLFEYTLLVIPTILNFTLLADYIHDVFLSLFVLSCSLFFFRTKGYRNNDYAVNLKHKPFITNTRSTINLMTAVAILAVDFRIFPRRFAKTETYGYSLMDVGVGLFVYSNGIVASQVRQSEFSAIKLIKSTIPLFVLGASRFFITKEIDYHVPVSEYGVHWNFFFTLAVTKIVGSLIINFVPMKYVIVNAVLLLLAHEVLLQLGLAKFVLSDRKRANFLLANREGIVSSLGYVSLYLFSVYFGALIHSKKEEERLYLPVKLSVASLFLICATFFLESNFGISRRLANSAYCCWILFIGVFMTNLYYICAVIQEYCFRGCCRLVPCIFDAINFNGLAFFLISNLLTGAVNIVFITQKFSSYSSLITLIVYMLSTCSVISLLFHKGIKLKI